MSCEPNLDEDKEQHHRQSAPNKQNLLLTIVSNDRYIILNVWIAIEKLMSPAEDKNSAIQKDDHGDRECDAQRRNASLFNHRYHWGNISAHEKRLLLERGVIRASPNRRKRVSLPGLCVDASLTRL